jgi:hypothetical protein
MGGFDIVLYLRKVLLNLIFVFGLPSDFLNKNMRADI